MTPIKHRIVMTHLRQLMKNKPWITAGIKSIEIDDKLAIRLRPCGIWTQAFISTFVEFSNNLWNENEIVISFYIEPDAAIKIY